MELEIKITGNPMEIKEEHKALLKAMRISFSFPLTLQGACVITQ